MKMAEAGAICATSLIAKSLTRRRGPRLNEHAIRVVRARSGEYSTSVVCFTWLIGYFRCDVLTESEPPLCQHCKQYGFECTFFLPITETRFKKKRLEEEAAERAAETERRATSSPRGDASVMGKSSLLQSDIIHTELIVQVLLLQPTYFTLPPPSALEYTKTGTSATTTHSKLATMGMAW
jgi:hypothetical protein